MSFFKRLKNIIRSNIAFNQGEIKSDDVNFDDVEFKGDYSFNEAVKPEQSAYSELEKEYYANLEVPCGSDFDTIKKAYRKLLKKYHPDKFYNDAKKLNLSQQVVKKLNIAYSYFENKFKT